MIHLRSVSDPPLASPTRLDPWELPASTNRPVTPLAPHNAQAYARRPLPPLPSMMNPSAIPPPLNISKTKKNKPAPLPVGPSSAPSHPASDDPPQIESGSASPRPAPRTPVKGPHPPRLSSLPSPTSSIKQQRTSKKVMQLMGYDVDVMNLASLAPEADQEVVARGSRILDDPLAVHPGTLLQLPEDGLIPVLEDDDGADSTSSKKSSWGPGSPHSASALPLASHSKHSIRRRRSARIFDTDGSGHHHHIVPQEEALMPSSMDLDEDNLSDDMAAGEYHKFAVELAAAGAKPSSGESSPPLVAKSRRSSILSFTSGSQFSRLRRRPTTAEPHAVRVSSSSSSSAETGLQAPLPAVPAPEPEEPAVPKSAFESDSDSEPSSSSRSIWRRDRSANKGDDRGRERGRDSVAGMARRDDESSRSRGWAKTGDQMKGLLAVGKRRREHAKREIGVVNESVFA